MKRLTRAEEQIMLVLWQKGKAFVKEILNELPEPKPAYNTVSTVIRILEEKAFVSHENFGRSHQYFPVISQEEYQKYELQKLKTDHFKGSSKALLSFFVESEEVDLKELEEILSLLKKKK